MADLICTNLVNGALVSNYAMFKHPTNQDENKGQCFFDYPTYDEESGKWVIKNIYGYNVRGTEFSVPDLEDTDGELSESDRLNPTKVFWFIVKKAKSYLCPTCM